MAPFTPRVKAGARRQASNYHPDAEPERTFRQRSRGLSRARSTGHSSGSLACQLLLLEKKATGLVSGGTSKFRRNVLRSRRFSPLWRPPSGCEHRGPRGEASALAVVSVARRARHDSPAGGHPPSLVGAAPAQSAGICDQTGPARPPWSRGHFCSGSSIGIVHI